MGAATVEVNSFNKMAGISKKRRWRIVLDTGLACDGYTYFCYDKWNGLIHWEKKNCQTQKPKNQQTERERDSTANRQGTATKCPYSEY